MSRAQFAQKLVFEEKQ
jgi:hypothetical protein